MASASSARSGSSVGSRGGKRAKRKHNEDDERDATDFEHDDDAGDEEEQDDVGELVSVPAPVKQGRKAPADLRQGGDAASGAGSSRKSRAGIIHIQMPEEPAASAAAGGRAKKAGTPTVASGRGRVMAGAQPRVTAGAKPAASSASAAASGGRSRSNRDDDEVDVVMEDEEGEEEAAEDEDASMGDGDGSIDVDVDHHGGRGPSGAAGRRQQHHGDGHLDDDDGAGSMDDGSSVSTAEMEALLHANGIPRNQPMFAVGQRGVKKNNQYHHQQQHQHAASSSSYGYAGAGAGTRAGRGAAAGAAGGRAVQQSVDDERIVYGHDDDEGVTMSVRKPRRGPAGAGAGAAASSAAPSSAFNFTPASTAGFPQPSFPLQQQQQHRRQQQERQLAANGYLPHTPGKELNTSGSASTPPSANSGPVGGAGMHPSASTAAITAAIGLKDTPVIPRNPDRIRGAAGAPAAAGGDAAVSGAAAGGRRLSRHPTTWLSELFTGKTRCANLIESRLLIGAAVVVIGAGGVFYYVLTELLPARRVSTLQTNMGAFLKERMGEIECDAPGRMPTADDVEKGFVSLLELRQLFCGQGSDAASDLVGGAAAGAGSAAAIASSAVSGVDQAACNEAINRIISDNGGSFVYNKIDEIVRAVPGTGTWTWSCHARNLLENCTAAVLAGLAWIWDTAVAHPQYSIPAFLVLVLLIRFALPWYLNRLKAQNAEKMKNSMQECAWNMICSVGPGQSIELDVLAAHVIGQLHGHGSSHASILAKQVWRSLVVPALLADKRLLGTTVVRDGQHRDAIRLHDLYSMGRAFQQQVQVQAPVPGMAVMGGAGSGMSHFPMGSPLQPSSAAAIGSAGGVPLPQQAPASSSASKPSRFDFITSRFSPAGISKQPQPQQHNGYTDNAVPAGIFGSSSSSVAGAPLPFGTSSGFGTIGAPSFDQQLNPLQAQAQQPFRGQLQWPQQTQMQPPAQPGDGRGVFSTFGHH